MRTFYQFIQEMHEYGTDPKDSQVNRNDLAGMWAKIPGKEAVAQWLAAKNMVPDEELNQQQVQQPAQIATGTVQTNSLEDFKKKANIASTNPIGTGKADAQTMAKAKADREAAQVQDRGGAATNAEQIPEDQIANSLSLAMNSGQYQYYRNYNGEVKRTPAKYYQKGGNYD